MNWVDKLGLYLTALDRADFPNSAICSHHGVRVSNPGVYASIGISPHNLGILITMYRFGAIKSERTFRRWRKGVSKYGNIINEWNGKPGNDGISIVIDRPAPRKFIHAIGNYYNILGVFKLRPEDENGFDIFHRTLDSTLKKILETQE